MERRLQQIADILQKEGGIMAVPCSGLEGLPGLVFTMPWNGTYRASAGLTLVLEHVVECETPVLIQGGIATPEDLIDRLTPPPPPPQPERLYQCEIRWRFNRKTRREGIAIGASEQKREWAKDRLIVLNRLQAERLAALAEMEQEVALEVA